MLNIVRFGMRQMVRAEMIYENPIQIDWSFRV